jgi:hypothetical protein
MRWWLYDGKKSTGPFSREDLARLSGFSPETALCREHKLGTPNETWHRAVDVPELASLFPPATREKAAAQPAGKPGPWPPDASRRDVDEFSGVEKRMEIVDRSIAAAQRRVTYRQERYHKLREELQRRIDNAEALDDKIRTMAAKIGGFVGLRQELDQAQAAMAMQQKRIGELQEQLEELKAPPPPPPEPEPEPEPASAPEPGPIPWAEPAFESKKPAADADAEPGAKSGRRKRRKSRRKRRERRGGADPFGGAAPESGTAPPPDPFF